MNNSNQEKKKELIIFIGIGIAIILLLIFEIFLFEGRPEVRERSNIVQKQLETMQGETVSKEQRTIYHAVNNIVDLMNNKEYKKVYDMLKDDYRDYYFREYDVFEEFIMKYASSKYYPKYTSYYRDKDLYYIMVEFMQDKYTREDLLNLRALKVDTLVLEEMDDGNFKFAMNGFVENIMHNSQVTKNDVTFYLVESVRNLETMKTTVMIENNSEKTLFASTNNIIQEISGGSSGKISVTTSIYLEPGEIGSLSIEYYMQYNSGKELMDIRITGVEFEDGTVIEDVYLYK